MRKKGKGIPEVKETVMSVAHVSGQVSRSLDNSKITPTVFVVDDDVAIRESLES
jgi:hypothetical protein